MCVYTCVDTKNVIKRLQSEMKDAEGIMKEGEEAVARLRGQLEEVQEREEISQQQLAHAITQVRPNLIMLVSWYHNDMIGRQGNGRKRCIWQDSKLLIISEM